MAAAAALASPMDVLKRAVCRRAHELLDNKGGAPPDDADALRALLREVEPAQEAAAAAGSKRERSPGGGGGGSSAQPAAKAARSGGEAAPAGAPAGAEDQEEDDQEANARWLGSDAPPCRGCPGCATVEEAKAALPDLPDAVVHPLLAAFNGRAAKLGFRFFNAGIHTKLSSSLITGRMRLLCKACGGKPEVGEWAADFNRSFEYGYGVDYDRLCQACLQAALVAAVPAAGSGNAAAADELPPVAADLLAALDARDALVAAARRAGLSAARVGDLECRLMGAINCNFAAGVLEEVQARDPAAEWRRVGERCYEGGADAGGAAWGEPARRALQSAVTSHISGSGRERRGVGGGGGRIERGPALTDDELRAAAAAFNDEAVFGAPGGGEDAQLMFFWRGGRVVVAPPLAVVEATAAAAATGGAADEPTCEGCSASLLPPRPSKSSKKPPPPPPLVVTNAASNLKLCRRCAAAMLNAAGVLALE